MKKENTIPENYVPVITYPDGLIVGDSMVYSIGFDSITKEVIIILK